jgi:hypothetical protein
LTREDLPMDRRSLFGTTATLGLGALAGCALPGVAQNSVKTPFGVPDTTIPIADSDLLFPVRRIYCIGRNYRAHAIEMGSNPDREPPFFFQKPTDAIQNVVPGAVADPAGLDLAEGQRPDQAERQPQRGRADQQVVRGLRADAWRHHLFRHAGERGPGGAWRCHRVPHRPLAQSQREDHLMRGVEARRTTCA